MNESKHALMSKTIWANLIAAIVAIVATKFPEAKEYASVENVSMVFMFMNMVLRMVTKGKIFFTES